MKRGFYLKLGFEGIRKNKQLYTPYLLSCTLMVLMFYMLSALGENPYLGSLRGGRTTQSVLQLGSFVMIIFSALLLFYSNSFMIRRRHREFGLYNVLGMSKRHIGRILLWESFLSGFFSLASGLIGGILFSKLFELGLLYLLKEQINYSITVSVTSLVGTVLYFGFVFCLLFIRSLFTLGRLKPTELLKAEKVGEKPPKANWVLAIIGALILSAAYFIAIIAPDPITALALFFLAVILVIIATYLLFISGSVSLCRFLQNRKGYYYKSNHFISVSSMAYRMKRNGAGLGSICILITMVLVMLSSTTCLYFGAEETINVRFPMEHVLSISYKSGVYTDRATQQTEALNDLKHIAVESMDKKDVYPIREQSLQLWNGYAYINEDKMLWQAESGLNNISDTSTVSQLTVVSLSDYNTITGENLSLKPGQLYIYSDNKHIGSHLYSPSGKSFEVLPLEQSFNGRLAMPHVITGGLDMTTSVHIVVEDLFMDDFMQEKEEQISYWGIYAFDASVSEKEWWEISDTGHYNQCMQDLFYKNSIIRSSFDGSKSRDTIDFYATFGGLLFLGVCLSIVFIAAAILMMYFKQLCEGYEDQSRFAIMQNVGLSKRDIRKTVNSQLLTVFFAPLLMAGVHLLFAFPMIKKILFCFGLSNSSLFLQTTLISLAAFTVLYVGIYTLSSRVYTRIVTGGGE